MNDTGCTVVIRLWRRQGRKTEDMRVLLPLSVPWGDPGVAVSVKEHASQFYPTWEVIGWSPQREMASLPHAELASGVEHKSE
jgi:hypothetical protein